MLVLNVLTRYIWRYKAATHPLQFRDGSKIRDENQSFAIRVSLKH